MSEFNGTSRLDRIERVLEAQMRLIEKQTEHIGKLVDHAERVNGVLQKTAQVQSKLAETQNRLELTQADTAEKLNVLIALVDSLVKRDGGQPPEAR